MPRINGLGPHWRCEPIATDLNTKEFEFCRSMPEVAHLMCRPKNILERLTAVTHGDIPAVLTNSMGGLKAIMVVFNTWSGTPALISSVKSR